jgi:hypothetical protein
MDVVDRLDGSGWIIDPRRQGALSDVHKLAEAESGILVHRPFPAKAHRRLDSAGGSAIPWASDREQGCSLADKISDAGPQFDDTAGVTRRPDYPFFIHAREEARWAGRNNHRRGCRSD